MTDSSTPLQTIKGGWMRRFINNTGIWREWMLEQINKVNYRYILRCNIKFDDLPFKLPVSSIWHDILAYIKRWADNNIMWDNDLLSGEGPYQLLSLEEMEAKYNMKIPFTECYGIIKAIPEK